MCNCTFCRNYHKYRWAKIIECKCGCHTDSQPLGHDSLCCEFPNGKRKDNPYKKLLPAEVYNKRINQWETECDVPLKQITK